MFIRFDVPTNFNSHLKLESLETSRGENGELRVGVRRAMRQQGNVPSSVISSHSMHLGVLATAWHAKSTGTMFTVYYKPRCVMCYMYLLY